MKKRTLFPLLMAAMAFAACSDADTTTDADTTDSTNTTATVPNADTASNMNTTAPNPNDTLNAMDKDFAMKAAKGGMMEVEAGNIALANSTNDRIKSFATMMVNDHTTANNELKSLSNRKNLMLPDSLDKKDRDHLESMRKMKGAAFDRHYVDMMVNDHKKTVDLFEKASKMCKDQECLGFAAKTLPTLRAHTDSAQALKKMKM